MESLSQYPIRFIVMGLVTFMPTLMATATTQAEDRPNIVIALADDWGRYASAYARLELGAGRSATRRKSGVREHRRMLRSVRAGRRSAVVGAQFHNFSEQLDASADVEKPAPRRDRK